MKFVGIIFIGISLLIHANEPYNTHNNDTQKESAFDSEQYSYDKMKKEGLQKDITTLFPQKLIITQKSCKPIHIKGNRELQPIISLGKDRYASISSDTFGWDTNSIIRLYNCQDKNESKNNVLDTHDDHPITSLAVSSNKNKLIVGRANGVVTIFDLTQNNYSNWQCSENSLYCVGFVKNNEEYIFATDSQNAFHLYNQHTQTEMEIPYIPIEYELGCTETCNKEDCIIQSNPIEWDFYGFTHNYFSQNIPLQETEFLWQLRTIKSKYKSHSDLKKKISILKEKLPSCNFELPIKEALEQHLTTFESSITEHKQWSIYNLLLTIMSIISPKENS